MLVLLSSASEEGSKHMSPTGGVVNEVSKQQVLVQYLKVSILYLIRTLGREIWGILEFVAGKNDNLDQSFRELH